MPPKAQPKGTKRAPEFNPVVAFYLFCGTHILSALYAPIQDCDEVFNFFEPTHYLDHGYGLQTWEYSPEYAVRSWAYAGLHAGIASVARLLPGSSKTTQFYFLRIVLGFFCACCETRLFSTIARTLNPRIAVFFLITMVFSPGMFYASTSYLPSSFAMYTNMLGVASFMDWKGGLRTAAGICWFAVGGILGWPFASVLILPFIAEEVFLAVQTGSLYDTGRRFLDGSVRSLCVLVLSESINSFFYRKLVCVPLNIVLYNVFSGPGKGPDIYGTEPWHFYARNLILNFNVWFILAVAALPLQVVNQLFRKQSTTKQSILRGIVFVSPFYLWLAIFTLQPHKEERFMYPVYPFLALNSAISLHVLLAYFGSSDPRELVGKIPAKLKLGVVVLVIMGAIDVGVWRALGVTTAYSAPLQIYEPLHQAGVSKPGDTVCLGKEWYRFPSSYFLPKGVKAKFVKSAFNGLLPGEFSEANVGFGLFPGAWLIPSGMNDENKEDPGKHTDLDHCTFMVDSSLPSWKASDLEPDYVGDREHWETVKCERFLDTAATSTLGRLGWVPDLPFVPERHRRNWGRYCLLRRKSTSEDSAIWIPSDFKRPAAEPYPNWSVIDSKPRPYRPFRYGPKYNTTMGLRTMDWNEWIELDNQYLSFHAKKAERLASPRASKLYHTAPEAYDGAVELLEELCSYLPQRYPSLFRKTAVGMDNLATGESLNIVERPLKEDPMAMCARQVQDDLAIMFERPDGQYYLLAGAILLAGFWRLEDKLGMPLSEIHTSGSVPEFKTKLEKGMMNFFRRVKPENPVVRNNYFIQVDEDLAWSHSIGPEDGEEGTIGWFSAEKDRAIEHHMFRSERQSLRRLPRSGGVVFTIRTYFHPITEICDEPYVPGRLASAVRSWNGEVSQYKGKERYEKVLLEYLDKRHEEQLANGLDLEREDDIRQYPW
ncbi:Alg9-like mannosyltransferase family-domain-containing protein [Macrophomina phaseolina]|uniref:Mannosyltransferase n=1 Tax=Macrophomina phaseolina TaxID=35725 RepID=A0ABQ8GTQ1_9PEZI|nr:Alg9-like mannosyltransferase family-domain-containing protein [Macrophomina phaseolina]